jgi:hypothetical protein
MCRAALARCDVPGYSLDSTVLRLLLDTREDGGAVIMLTCERSVHHESSAELSSWQDSSSRSRSLVAGLRRLGRFQLNGSRPDTAGCRPTSAAAPKSNCAGRWRGSCTSQRRT